MNGYIETGGLPRACGLCTDKAVPKLTKEHRMTGFCKITPLLHRGKIMARHGILLVLALWLCSAGINAQTPKENSGVPTNITTGASMLESIPISKAKRIEVIHLSLDVLTPISVNPDRLENGYSYKMTIRETGNMNNLMDALKNTRIKTASRESDLRYGVILFDHQDNRLASIYLDRSGKYGYVDLTPVSFEIGIFGAGLHKWLNKILSCFY
jgi:hypothetical protein